MTVWTASGAVTPVQRSQAQTILRAFGKELYVADEAFLDMATAISGSGPSYVFLFMEALIDAAVHLGFSREDARTLVTQTVRGSAIYAESSASHPAEMRNLVTSPGGTSAHALYQLEKGGFRTLLSKAVWAAFQRSVSLSALNSAVQPFEEQDEPERPVVVLGLFGEQPRGPRVFQQLELLDRVLADVIERFIEIVGHEKQLQIAGAHGPRLHHVLEQRQEPSPVGGPHQNDRVVQDLLRLNQRQRFVELVERPQPAGQRDKGVWYLNSRTFRTKK